MSMMEKNETRPGYFARLKKRRQMKQSQSEKAAAEQIQSDPETKTPVIRERASIGQSQGENPETKRGQSEDDNSKSYSQSKKEKSKPAGTVEYMVFYCTVNVAGMHLKLLCNNAKWFKVFLRKVEIKYEFVNSGQTECLFCFDWQVGAKDTLNSIALKFNNTPNQLVQLNRLYSHSVVPGQKLFVPDVNQSERGSQTDEPINTDSSERKLKRDGESSSRPVRRETSPPSEDESLATVKFIKMSCKYVTDGMGVVGGVMIITPNNIMFDPHKSDPVVIENGCEEYGLICPMEEVLSVALYDDISRMKLKDALPSPGEWEELPSEQDLNPFSRYEALGPPSRPIVLDDMETAVSDISACQMADKSPSDEGFTELELPQSDSNTTCPSQEGASFHQNYEPRDTSNPSPSDQKEDEDEGLHHRSTEDSGVLLQSVSDGIREPAAAVHDGNEVNIDVSEGAVKEATAWHGGCGDVETQKQQKESTSAGEVADAERRRRTSETDVKSWLLKRMQGPIEDMLLSHEEKSKTPPMFLCFKVGKPMRKSFAIGRTSSPAHSFISRGRQPEYWFAVPQERVDHLYSFFIQWSPDTYGKDAQEHGFVLVEKDELNMIDNFFSDPVPRSWEIITINEAKRRQSLSFEDEDSLDLFPLLMDPSVLLEDTHIEKLATRLPARVQGYPWRLVYSTVVHGTSLKTLYRNLLDVDCPVLLVIRDMNNQVFGAFSTHPFRVSEHYYGTGETFLYTFCPEIKVFCWSGENSYFVKGNTDSLQIGGGGGRLGLWLDADLDHGTTSRCSTFSNPPLSSKHDFIVQNLEVWAFE
ncbi:nuclear receptor coactivator 7 isoform X2 [Triplophysa rosa]|uniref:Nuclear receptor coactivator 7-like n=1 Tax=Triplophysa rosa TaxID=992332 RepID=A0A9W7TIW0_TRIRA|nr:nuclear receptor coactivator 7 isoform X2 [Triplophysa rosa]KAI7799618.1 putative nuclear receptor coactivator 7-like [Triplophysa rosa]